MAEIDVRVIQVEVFDEWFVLPGVPRVGEHFNMGHDSLKISEVHWLPNGTEEHTFGHVVIFLEADKPKPDGKKPHPWKSR